MSKKYTTRALLFTAACLCASTSLALDNGYYYNSNNYTHNAYPTNGNAYDADYGMGMYHTRHKPSPYARTGKDFYVYGGYFYSHVFLTSKTHTVLNPTASPSLVEFSAHDIFPDSLNSIEIGFGKQWGCHFDMQLAYIQQLKDQRSGTVTPVNGIPGPATGTLSVKGVALNFIYILNPDDRFQIGALLGVTIADRQEEFTFNDQQYFPSDTTEINPSAGLSTVFYLSPCVALRLRVAYTLSTYRNTSSGQINGFVGLSYTL